MFSIRRQRSLANTKLTIWRPMNSTEQIILAAEGGEKNLPDLNQYRTTVSSWKVTEGTDEVRIDASADDVVDAKDHFAVAYTYTIHRDGALTVHYAIQPQLQARWLPLIGMTLGTVPAINHVRWLGLGPLDAYPNEKAAAILGVWSGDLASKDIQGVKATRWAELTGNSGVGIHVEGASYLRIDNTVGVQALSAVAGRPSKRVRPEEPAQRLDVTPNSPFVGEFNLSLMKAAD
jgi:beta-galactosidase